MQYKVFIIFLLCVGPIFTSYAQSDIINDQATLFRVPNSKDTIDFIVINTNLSEKKPLLLWCQGSLPYPLFLRSDAGEVYLMGGGI